MDPSRLGDIPPSVPEGAGGQPAGGNEHGTAPTPLRREVDRRFEALRRRSADGGPGGAAPGEDARRRIAQFGAPMVAGVKPGERVDETLAAPQYVFTLSTLESLTPGQIDMRSGGSLPRLIKQVLAGEAARLPAARGVVPRQVDEIVAALRAGEPLVPAHVRVPPVTTWLGTVDVSRLNGLGRYLELDRPDLALMLDLWVAHALGLVPMRFAGNANFNNPPAIRQLLTQRLGTAGRRLKSISVSWHEQILIGERIRTLAGNDEAGRYRGNAGQVRLVQELQQAGRLTSTHLAHFFGALEPDWKKMLDWSVIYLPLSEAVAVRDAVQALVMGDDFKDYRGDAGQIRFVQARQEGNAITSTHLARFFSALDPDWKKVLGWSQIQLPLAEAVAIREAVQALVTGGDFEDYRGDAGQIRFVQELQSERSLISIHLAQFFSALEPDWWRSLDWSRIGLPLAEAVAIREAVQALVTRGDFEDYRGDAGQIRFVQALREGGVIASTHLGFFFSALEPDWKRALGWSLIRLRLADAVAIRDAVQALVREGQFQNYTGNAGQIRFVQALWESGVVTSTQLGQFFSALEADWRQALGWHLINLSLAEAVAMRDAVRSLVTEGNVEHYRGDAGQIRFVHTLKEERVITSTHLGQFFSALEADWRRALDWSLIQLPLVEAFAIREAVQKVVAEGHLERYRGNAGQIRFVQTMREKESITSTHLRHFFSALDADWRRALDWSLINLPLAEVVAMRGAVQTLLKERDMENYQNYRGDAGQIRFVQTLKAGNVITSTNLGQFFTALEPDWKRSLGWSLINLPLEKAVHQLSAISKQVSRGEEGPVIAVIDGVQQRVSVEAQGRVTDWFATDGVPRRLQTFSGRLVGFPLVQQDGVSMLVLRLRAPLGYAVYSFDRWLPAQAGTAGIEVQMEHGIPESFTLWSEGRRQSILASQALVLGKRPGIAYTGAGGGTYELEMVDAGASVSNQAEQQVMATTLQGVLRERYGEDEAMRIIGLFSEFDAWTQDEGLSEAEAYRRLEEEFGVSRQTFDGYRGALRELLNAHGFGAHGFKAEA